MRLKNGVQSLGKSLGGWTTKIHLVAANARDSVDFIISAEQDGDFSRGRELIDAIGANSYQSALLIDMAYEANEARRFVEDLGHKPVVPPNPRRVELREYGTL